MWLLSSTIFARGRDPAMTAYDVCDFTRAWEQFLGGTVTLQLFG